MIDDLNKKIDLLKIDLKNEILKNDDLIKEFEKKINLLKLESEKEIEEVIVREKIKNDKEKNKMSISLQNNFEDEILNKVSF